MHRTKLQCKARAFQVYHGNRDIDCIIIHGTHGRKTGDLVTLTGNDPKHIVSCHGYIDRQGNVYEIVADNDIAYHAGVGTWRGRSNPNLYSLGLELENRMPGHPAVPQGEEYTPEQLSKAVAWCRWKMELHGIPASAVVSHETTAKAAGRNDRHDPGDLFPWDWFISRLHGRTYRVRLDGTRVRQEPGVTGVKLVSFDGGKSNVLLPAGRLVPVGAVVSGEKYTMDTGVTKTTSDQWAHWVEDGNENGFIWMPLLEPV